MTILVQWEYSILNDHIKKVNCTIGLKNVFEICDCLILDAKWHELHTGKTTAVIRCKQKEEAVHSHTRFFLMCLLQSFNPCF